MNDEDRHPLNWEASAHPTHSTVSAGLPPEVVACLRNARFLHLATCSPTAEPHISLMSHTYLPATPWTSGPTIIMTTNPASRKTAHLLANPRVSLLVHDWVAPRVGGAESGTRPPGGAVAEGLRAPADAVQHEASNSTERSRTASSSLASLLLGFNRAALGRISATVAGTARVLPAGGEEERWLRERHVESHGFKGSAVEDEDEAATAAEGNGVGGAVEAGADGAPLARETTVTASEGFLEGEDVRVVVVEIKEGRIADWKGGLKDFVIETGNRQVGAANGA